MLARRERLQDPSPAKKSARRCGRLLNPFLSREFLRSGASGRMPGRPCRQEASMRQVTDVVLCPYKEPCFLGTLSTSPPKGGGTTNGSRSFGLRVEMALEHRCKEPETFRPLSRLGGLWSIHLRSFEECILRPHPGGSFLLSDVGRKGATF